MVRSSGFGSTSCNYVALVRLAFTSAPRLDRLTSLQNVTRRPVLHSHKIPRVPWYSGYSYLFSHFAYGIVTLFDHFSNMFGYAIVNVRSPLPRCISLYSGLGSSPFARHYSENHLLIFSSSGYLDVSVPRVPLAKLCIHLTIPALRQVSSLIRTSADRSSCAAPRSFSQLVTSFFGA